MERLKRTLNWRKVLDLALVVLIGWLSWSTVATLAYANRANQEAIHSFAVLDEENARTLAMLKDLQVHQSSAYVEKVAREDLLLSRPGDTVILFPKAAVETPVDTRMEAPGLPAFVARIIAWVKGLF